MALWGKFDSPAELRKFSFLGGIFFFIIGIYWALRPIKDSIFMSVVGPTYLPYAKMLSLCIILPIVLLYTKLVDWYPRHRVFYGLLFVYGVLAAIFWWTFSDPVSGLANPHTSPYRIIGWLWYVWVESFGSLIVALFWAITTDMTMPEAAKRGFPIIAFFGQLGNIFGPLVMRARWFGFANSAPIVGIISLFIFFMILLFWVFRKTTPKNLLVGYHMDEEAEKEPGFFEGLKLIITHKYLMGMFLVISIYEVIITIFDNHFKQSVAELLSSEVLRSAYLQEYAVWTGIISTLCVLFGINNIQRRLGMTASLILLPILVGLAVVIVKINPMMIDTAFWVMVLAKAVNYALNQPTMKQLYIPTTKDTKYKSQAWIEMFGSRGAKAGGSVINTFRARFIKASGLEAGLSTFWTMSLLLSFGLIGLWLMIALFVAKSYNKAIKENRVVC